MAELDLWHTLSCTATQQQLTKLTSIIVLGSKFTCGHAAVLHLCDYSQRFQLAWHLYKPLNAQAALPSPCRASITSNVLSIFGRFQYDRIYLPSIEYPVWIETPHASTVWLVVWVLSVSSWMQSWGIEPFSMCVTFLSTPAYFLLVFFSKHVGGLCILILRRLVLFSKWPYK